MIITDPLSQVKIHDPQTFLNNLSKQTDYHLKLRVLLQFMLQEIEDLQNQLSALQNINGHANGPLQSSTASPDMTTQPSDTKLSMELIITSLDGSKSSAVVQTPISIQIKPINSGSNGSLDNVPDRLGQIADIKCLRVLILTPKERYSEFHRGWNEALTQALRILDPDM